MEGLKVGNVVMTKGVWQRSGPSELMSCPECGKIISLLRHLVRENGEVFPSVICSNDSCSFHDFVKLEGWVECVGD